jgi:ribosomal protein L37AE/L43A
MPKNKLKTPEWILKGDKKPEKKTQKIFKIRKCPECGSDDVGVVVGEDAKGMWECKSCEWKGTDVQKQELNEDEMMKYLDEKGEEVN